MACVLDLKIQLETLFVCRNLNSVKIFYHSQKKNAFFWFSKKWGVVNQGLKWNKMAYSDDYSLLNFKKMKDQIILIEKYGKNYLVDLYLWRGMITTKIMKMWKKTPKII